MSERILQEVSKTAISLLLEEPFYGHFLTGLTKEVTSEVPTIAVALSGGKLFKLCINGRFWLEELTDGRHRRGVVKHEILHLALGHLLVAHKFGNRSLFNIAADIVVNQYIEPEQLPAGAVLLEQFADLGLMANQDVGYYYRRLMEAVRQGSGPVQPGAPQDADGSPGSGMQRLNELLGQGSKDSWLERHQPWPQKLSAAARANLEQLREAMIHNASQRLQQRDFGKLPGQLQAYLRDVAQRTAPATDWRRALRLFAASSSRTRLKNTIRRPSKRYGTTPGIKIQRKQKLLVAIDTSGSVPDQDIQRFFSEIYQIWRHGAEVLVVECDTEIKRQYPYRGITPKFIMGRGGTDFNAPLEFANQHYLPDAVIYFTDGYAALPRTESRRPVLWMITPGGLQEHTGIWDELPGRKVKMNG
ncbi:MAG: hypothetical protein KDC66_20555 [Phaeodactylibacter sp.]|nr:hypothetical protein [Phaeodactylibacter sp.]MCB9273505.1 hypothetical protein [Lewinellaceae bacterium]